MFPIDAVKLTDRRHKSKENLLDMIDHKKKELDTRRPLAEGEIERLGNSLLYSLLQCI